MGKVGRCFTICGFLVCVGCLMCLAGIDGFDEPKSYVVVNCGGDEMWMRVSGSRGDLS